MKGKDFGIQYQNNNNDDVFDLNISIDRNSDGKILSGITIGATLEQNIASLLVAVPGDFKLMPKLGVNIRSALLAEDLLEYRHAIKSHFAEDNLAVKHLDLYDLKTFSIDAKYEK